MRHGLIALGAVLVSVAVLVAVGATSAATVLPKPPAGKATIGGKWTQLGKPVRGEGVDLYRGKASKATGKAKTDSYGNFLFKAVLPGSYHLSIAIVMVGSESDMTCSLPGFVFGLSIGGTNKAGEHVTLSTADSKPFTVKAGDRVTRDIVVACKPT